jgi:hypothetical protein
MSTSATTKRVPVPIKGPVMSMPKESHVIKDSDYAREIFNDLPTLIKEQPNGITLSHMMSYYGESAFRTVKALEILANQDKLSLHKTAANAYYVLPKGYKAPIPETLLVLTELQRELFKFLVVTASRSTQKLVKTNYAQLARVMNSSIGGVKAAIHRLDHLAYVRIHKDSKRGFTDQLLLEVTKDV